MKVLFDMANNSTIDGDIVKDIDTALAHFDGGDLPAP
jgi:hypothetical protein